MDIHRIAAGGLVAAIKAEGAELCSLGDRSGREYLWQAHPAWPWHAPVLFPIVGALKGEHFRHRGRSYAMSRHGFARASRFAWTERTQTSCRLALVDSEASRAIYPFAFRFEVAYAVAGGVLAIDLTVTNTGAETLPASLGLHPAWNWPLLPGIAKSAHVLDFELAEPAPIRRLDRHGLVLVEPVPSPIDGRELQLDEALFVADAIIMQAPLSRSLRYFAPGTPRIELAWDGFPQLGIWSPPGGADFLCIEPWHGTASPEDFDGEIIDKPGMMLIPPGGSRSATHSVRISYPPA
jgi:galactose mutarotase-like enzyme